VLTLAALTLLAVTGIVLTQFYNPTPLGAHESLRYVITRTSLVTLLRDERAAAAAGVGLGFVRRDHEVGDRRLRLERVEDLEAALQVDEQVLGQGVNLPALTGILA
jgi:hypothetical protein